MPWCSRCERYRSFPTATPDGACPHCGQALLVGAAPRDRDGAEDPLGPIPWHLKVTAGAVAVYLGYRLFQGVEWLVGRW